MAIREIKGGVFSIGAIDWDRRVFDELIPLPNGTSYNAYLIKGREKTALIDTVDPTLQISKSVLITVVLCVGVIAALAAYLVIKAQSRKPFTGSDGMVGKIAEVRTHDLVYVEGALWRAEFTDDVKKGDKVEVIGMDKLTLKVKKI